MQSIKQPPWNLEEEKTVPLTLGVHEPRGYGPTEGERVSGRERDADLGHGSSQNALAMDLDRAHRGRGRSTATLGHHGSRSRAERGNHIERHMHMGRERAAVWTINSRQGRRRGQNTGRRGEEAGGAVGERKLEKRGVGVSAREWETRRGKAPEALAPAALRAIQNESVGGN
jgi:hypothetical protein